MSARHSHSPRRPKKAPNHNGQTVPENPHQIRVIRPVNNKTAEALAVIQSEVIERLPATDRRYVDLRQSSRGHYLGVTLLEMSAVAYLSHKYPQFRDKPTEEIRSGLQEAIQTTRNLKARGFLWPRPILLGGRHLALPLTSPIVSNEIDALNNALGLMISPHMPPVVGRPRGTRIEHLSLMDFTDSTAAGAGLLALQETIENQHIEQVPVTLLRARLQPEA